MLKVNNKGTRTTTITFLFCLTVNFEQIWRIVIVFSIVEFEQIQAIMSQ